MAWQLGFRLVHLRNGKLTAPNQVWNRIFGFRFSDKTESLPKPDDEKLVERKPLSGYVYDEGIEGYKSIWRLPFIEKKGFFKTKLAAFASKKFPANLTRLNPDNFKYYDINKWWKKETKEKMIYDQQFIEERLIALGCDLAAAHFIVFRGGAVKFKGYNQWIRDNKTEDEYDVELPNRYDPNYIVEAIDCSKTHIIYEGLRNFENLTSLKWLSFANCAYFDDWCLDRVSGEHRNNLEYLDISFTSVTHRGLHTLYRFNKLKTVKIDECNDDPLYFQTCLELQKEFKELNVELVKSESLPKEQQQIEPNSNVTHVQG